MGDSAFGRQLWGDSALSAHPVLWGAARRAQHPTCLEWAAGWAATLVSPAVYAHAVFCPHVSAPLLAGLLACTSVRVSDQEGEKSLPIIRLIGSIGKKRLLDVQQQVNILQLRQLESIINQVRLLKMSKGFTFVM